MITFKEKISKRNYLGLKNKLKALAIAGTALRQAADKNKGDVRYLLRNHKRTNGGNARLYHVALSFLRGKKYYEVEPNVASPLIHNQIRSILWWYVDSKYQKQLDADLTEFFVSIKNKEKAA